MMDRRFAWLPVRGWDYLTRTDRWLWRERILKRNNRYVTYAGSAGAET